MEPLEFFNEASIRGISGICEDNKNKFWIASFFLGLITLTAIMSKLELIIRNPDCLQIMSIIFWKITLARCGLALIMAYPVSILRPKHSEIIMKPMG
jgi:hypothetical protein